jgi:hypothetical protein
MRNSPDSHTYSNLGINDGKKQLHIKNKFLSRCDFIAHAARPAQIYSFKLSRLPRFLACASV